MVTSNPFGRSSIRRSNMALIEGDYYEVQYDEFVEGGTYRIAIYAEDALGRSASPKVLSLRIGEVVFLPFISH